jgi:hypothetical protein
MYVKDISIGAFMNDPKIIPGTKIYVYRVGDSTYTYSTLKTYPNNVYQHVTLNLAPSIRVNGKAEITNANDFGLFLTAFNLQNTISTDDAADIVITDNSIASIDAQFIQDNAASILQIDSSEFLKDEKNNVIYPNEIYYVIGANITSIAMTKASKITDATQVTTTVFKMQDNYYASGNISTFDYKIGLSYKTIFNLNDNSSGGVSTMLNNNVKNSLVSGKKVQQIQQKVQEQLKLPDIQSFHVLQQKQIRKKILNLN